ncbi:hypothetical protein [Lactiplantibacillus pentosus]|uniref:hypothetical protein n=1 Tax=Lactiplantibacillus pentosus TaxID=1589 RepID=UPI00132F687F|nr:hypothetical protein [Lactiplantibacillus pentosus]MBQ0837915.1 hypothetical protein [Lactiplantibacillus pentosus]MCT3305000.1 hypothetical protein [Lactiplantibacillus pentosus]
MQKQVAGTILYNDEQGTHFLVGKSGNGYHFYQLPVQAGRSPLASVLWTFRHTIGIDVEQLRLYDSIVAKIEGEKVAVFVFDHLTVDELIQTKFAEQGLMFVLASELHELFASVSVGETTPFNQLSK